MKSKGLMCAIGLSVMSLSAFAADQVVKEETTASAPEEAITTDQIPALYSPPPSTQPTTPPPPTDINQPVTPSNTVPPGTPNVAPQQPTTQVTPQSIPARQPPETMQGTVPLNTMPGQSQQPQMPSTPQSAVPQQQQMIQQNGQERTVLTPSAVY